ncbi:hypothetical protein [Sphaerisporangium fuscum]|uniref:hypothetical protein n=1 Tax=Sphaerisporangium fuscum TaxID=2835868 RepID=UPI001BDD842A|nr:hypothetical protein [Sphaerisporangium fuscum]
MSAGRTWRAWGLRAASVVLPVAVAVAGNQILNNGVWNWWWGAVAVTLTALSTLVTCRLTGPSPTTAAGAATAVAMAGANGGGKVTQTVDGSTAAGDITQVQGVGGGVRIVRGRGPSSPPSAPAAADPSAEEPGGDAGVPRGGARQAVTGAQAGGSIEQISRVRGDVDIESS